MDYTNFGMQYNMPSGNVGNQNPPNSNNQNVQQQQQQQQQPSWQSTITYEERKRLIIIL